jgi:hypothetical protein
MAMEGDVEEHSGYLDEVGVPYRGREYVLMTLQKYLTKSCWVLICVACKKVILVAIVAFKNPGR